MTSCARGPLSSLNQNTGVSSTVVGGDTTLVPSSTTTVTSSVGSIQSCTPPPSTTPATRTLWHVAPGVYLILRPVTSRTKLTPGGLVLDPLLQLGVVGLAVPLPLFPLLISREGNVTGVEGGGIVRVSALAVWLGGGPAGLLRPLCPLLAIVTPCSTDTACVCRPRGFSITMSA